MLIKACEWLCSLFQQQISNCLREKPRPSVFKKDTVRSHSSLQPPLPYFALCYIKDTQCFVLALSVGSYCKAYNAELSVMNIIHGDKPAYHYSYIKLNKITTINVT